jgi:hypothetical protein
VGVLLGIVFGASSLYLVLKVGLTVSASIPVAVISITLFRLLSKFGLTPATNRRMTARAKKMNPRKRLGRRGAGVLVVAKTKLSDDGQMTGRSPCRQGVNTVYLKIIIRFSSTTACAIVRA